MQFASKQTFGFSVIACLLLANFAIALADEPAIESKQNAAESNSSQHVPLVLENATLHTMSSQGTFVGSLVIEDGKITAIGKQVQAPENARHVDLKNFQVVPGLIESRSKLWLTAAATKEGNSKAELNVIDGIDPWSEDWRELAAQGITSVYVQTNSDSFLGGYGAVLHVGPFATPDAIVLKKEAAVQLALGTKGTTSKDRLTQFKAFEKLLDSAVEKKKPESKEDDADDDSDNSESDDADKDESEVGETDEDKDDDSQSNEDEDEDKDESETDKETDPTKLALRRVLNKEIPLFVEVHHSDTLREVLKLAEKHDLRIVLDGLSQMESCCEELNGAGHPMVLGPLYELKSPPAYRQYADFDWLCEDFDANQLWALSSFADTARPSRMLRYQAASAIRAGLDHESVLAAMTSNAARILGVADQVGSLEVGKLADIAVFAGDPLDPCSATRMVISGGDITFESDVAANESKVFEATPLPERLPASYAVKSSRVWRDGKFVSATLVINDGKITAAGDDTPPAEIRVFDLKDTIITPGLVIADTMLGQSKSIVDSSESDTSHLRAIDAFDPVTKQAKEALQGGFVHIGLSPGTTNTSAGVLGHVRLGAVDYVANPAIANQFVLSNAARRQDRFPSSQNGQIQLLNDLFRGESEPTSIYVTSAISRSLAQEKIANAQSVIDGDRKAVVVADSKLEIRSAIALAKKHGFAPALMSQGQVGDFAEQLTEQKIGLIVPAASGEEYDSQFEQTVIASRAGVPVAFSGDSPEKIRTTASLLVNAGLTPEAALAGLTEGGANLIGMNSIGLSVGNPADFVVWSDSPLNFAAKPLNVVVDGQPISTK